MKYSRGSAGNDLILFVLFIIALGVIWASTGGPDRAISRSGPFLGSPLGEEGTSGVPTVDLRTRTNSDGSIISQITNNFVDLQSGEERSPYAEYVSLSISSAREENPNEEYLTIKTARTVTGTLTISDWRLESTVSNISLPLGPGAQLPVFGRVNSELPVAIGANTTVYVVSGRSPVGMSFRLNTCTGYFEQFQDFEPRLPIECPFPTEALTNATKRFSNYTPSSACRSFISRFGRCETNTNSGPPLESQCQTVAFNDLTYNGCIGLHSNDAGFYKNEWRLFLDQDQELWDQNDDRIRLLDENGFVIDVVSY